MFLEKIRVIAEGIFPISIHQAVRELPAHMVAVTLRSDSVRFLEELDAYVYGVAKCGAGEEAFRVRGVRNEEL
jgi:hypothetical protein